MVGKQLIDNLLELLAASRRSCGRCCCNKDKDIIKKKKISK